MQSILQIVSDKCSKMLGCSVVAVTLLPLLLSCRKGFPLKRRWAFCSIVALGFLLRYAFLLNRRKGLSLCSRSSREGFSFLLPEQKKRNKENSPSALFCLLRHFSPLNKKNSLRSNSFLFFTLRKAPPFYGKKVRPDLYVFFMQHRFARWGVVFSFFASLVYFVIQTIPLSKNQNRFSMSGAKDLVYIHATSEAMCPPREGYFRPQ